MTITVNDLNNIETSLTTPQAKGIFYINDNNGTLDCSYNQIIEQLQLGNLPVIKIQDNNMLNLNYIFINAFSSIQDVHYDIFAGRYDNYTYGAETINDYMQGGIEE